MAVILPSAGAVMLQGNSGSAVTEVAVQPSTARPMGAAELQKAVGQNLGGDSPLSAASWDFGGCDFAAGLFVPAAAIKAARRQAVAALLAARQQAAAVTAAGLPQQDLVADMLAQVRQAGSAEAAGQTAQQEPALPGAAGERLPAGEGALPVPVPLPMLRVLCRSKAQVDAALALPWLQEVVLDFLEVRGRVGWWMFSQDSGSMRGPLPLTDHGQR